MFKVFILRLSYHSNVCDNSPVNVFVYFISFYLSATMWFTPTDSFRTLPAPFWFKLQLKSFLNMFLFLFFCNLAGGLTVTLEVLNVRLQLYSCWMWLRFQVGSGPLSTWTFTSRHQVRGELWRQVEPVPVPLLAPKHSESSVSRSSSGSDSLINCSDSCHSSGPVFNI